MMDHFFSVILDIKIVQGSKQFNVDPYDLNYDDANISCTGLSDCCDEVKDGVAFSGQINVFPSWFNIHEPFTLYYDSLSINFNSSTTTTTISSCAAEVLLEDDPEDLNTLRVFRDEVLMQSDAGREYVKLYYRWSPAIVKLLNENQSFKEETKKYLYKILPTIKRFVDQNR